MKSNILHILLLSALVTNSCNPAPQPSDTLQAEEPTAQPSANHHPSTRPLSRRDVKVDRQLLYDRYTLNDNYEYQDEKRSFKWKQIRQTLAEIENMQSDSRPWIVMQNYQNRNQEAPLVKEYARNSYNRIADTYGVERYQSVPLFEPDDPSTPERYGRDGSIAHLCGEEGGFYRVATPSDNHEWLIPKRYVKRLPNDTRFEHVIFVDRGDQNITTLEWQSRGRWLIRSKNPATTGRRRPPYAQATPLGIFLLQEQKLKMIYLKDGSSQVGGYAPYASRFTNGAYIHGVPVKAPRKEPIEYSWSLGTIPRSHMCVRNATSHSKFVYEWAPVCRTLVVIIE